MKYLDSKSLISSNDFFNLECVFLLKKKKMLFSSSSESFKKKKDINIIENNPTVNPPRMSTKLLKKIGIEDKFKNSKRLRLVNKSLMLDLFKSI